VSDSHHNKIESNRINSNDGAGIFIKGTSEQNLVKYNIIDNNSRGVFLIDPGFNDITKNDIFENKVKNFETFYTNFAIIHLINF
jgi:parallel beta-helix repeat protein